MPLSVKELQEKLDLTLVAGKDGLDNQVNRMYIGDLLSWVMGKAKEGNIWVTIQGHINIVAVAALTGVSCIVIAEGAQADENTIEKANNEGVPVFITKLTAFELAERFVKLNGN